MLKRLESFWIMLRLRYSNLGRALRYLTREFFYSGQSLSWMKEENKQRIRGEVANRIYAIKASPDPIAACRYVLVDHVLAFAAAQVLCLTEEEKDDQHYAHNPYITGEIHHSIGAAVAFNDDMVEVMAGVDDGGPADLLSLANTRSALFLYLANALNMVRIDLGDAVEGNDWYLPFVEAQIVAEEDRLRDRLGMARLVPHSLGGLPYHSFFEIVLAGHHNPAETWRQKFPELCLSPAIH